MKKSKWTFQDNFHLLFLLSTNILESPSGGSKSRYLVLGRSKGLGGVSFIPASDLPENRSLNTNQQYGFILINQKSYLIQSIDACYNLNLSGIRLFLTPLSLNEDIYVVHLVLKLSSPVQEKEISEKQIKLIWMALFKDMLSQ